MYYIALTLFLSSICRLKKKRKRTTEMNGVIFSCSLKNTNEFINAKYTNKYDFILNSLKIAEYILTEKKTESIGELKFPYLCIDNNKRVYIVKNNQIISHSFPFDIKIKDNENEIFKIFYRSIEVTLEKISQNISLLNDLKKKYRYNLHEFFIDLFFDIQSIEDTDKYQILEVLLTAEPSYLRFDYAPEDSKCNNKKHPPFHIDVNFCKDMSYKIGLVNKIECEDFMDIISKETDCWVLKS